MAGNTYKNNTVKDEPKEKVKLNININFDFMKDNRFRIAIGLVLIVVAMNFLMSFIYFLFTGENDYSIVESLGEIEFYYLATEVDNSWGLVGATLSQYLIMRWFGIGVFSLVPILLMYAAKFLFNKPMRLLPKVLNISFFMTIWLSITLGYFYYIGDDSNSYLGHICGGIGYDIAFVLNGLVGWGTVFIQLLSLSIYLVYFFNIRSFKQLLEPLVDDVDESAFEENNELQEHVVIDHTEQEPLYNDGTETYEEDDSSSQEEEALIIEEPITKTIPVEEKIIEPKVIDPIQPEVEEKSILMYLLLSQSKSLFL